MKHLEIDSNLHETKQHGEYTFPYMIYRGKIPEYQYSYPLHWHEEMELILVVSGKGYASVNSKNYLLSSGDILVIRPHDVHSIKQYKNLEWEYFNILFRFSILEDKLSPRCYENHFKPFLKHSKDLPVHIVQSHPISKDLTLCLNDLINNRKKTLLNYELMIKSNLFRIMYILEQYAIPNKNFNNRIESDLKIKTALTYINEHYNESIKIDDIANSCCYSKSYFMKFFKKYTGSSFIQYLNNYRLEIAFKLLTDTEYKITDIASRVGFDNIPYFTRCFHKKYNISPSTLRKRNNRFNLN